MKNECNIVKDLLPLYIDGAVSEDSRRLVDEHTAICEECAKERREMMLALPENQEPQVEQTVLKKAARKLRRKHMRRGGLLTVAGVLLGILLIAGGRWLHWYLWEDWSIPMALDEYDIRMSTLEQGQLVLSYIWQSDSPGFSCRFYYEDAENGGCVIIFEPHTTRLRHPTANKQVRTDNDFIWQDGKILTQNGQQVVAMAKQGSHGEREFFYQYGVDESLIIPASSELEEYCRLDDEIALCWELYYAGSSIRALIDETELPFARIGNDDDALRAKLDELRRAQSALSHSVPEWQ